MLIYNIQYAIDGENISDRHNAIITRINKVYIHPNSHRYPPQNPELQKKKKKCTTFVASLTAINESKNSGLELDWDCVAVDVDEKEKVLTQP